MNKLKDFNEVMEEMDKIEESSVSDSLLEDLYEIYKDEINEEEADDKVAVSSINTGKEVSFEQSEQNRI